MTSPPYSGYVISLLRFVPVYNHFLSGLTTMNVCYTNSRTCYVLLIGVSIILFSSIQCKFQWYVLGYRKDKWSLLVNLLDYLFINDKC